MAIITIKDLLRLKGLDINSKIKLVRHKDTRHEKYINGNLIQGNPYFWYRNDPDMFIAYQCEQSKDVFKDVDYIVSFVGESGTLARFVGIFKILSSKLNSSTNKINYQMEEVFGFDELKERIIIDWGLAAQSWHQWLDKNDKNVIEITPGFDYIFTGYSNVILNYSQLQDIIIKNEYPEWKRMLSSVNCIYVITDQSTGNNYIGSTYNREGIWQRWKVYAKTGHGNNKILKELCLSDNKYANNFSWSILEILPLGISNNEAIAIESLYKKKLGTRAYGLNQN